MEAEVEVEVEMEIETVEVEVGVRSPVGVGSPVMARRILQSVPEPS